ncbi:MAG: TetR/AcrR family transcriptional regulator [Anaerolineae bacterium]|nr:TetR/AcrR family transcriptional regulator [Anaerolineae bacterium]
MSQPINNLRLRRTQKLLREALIELIEERGFEALTISEITQRAMVSRAAFYRNYHDKYDLVERIFGEAMHDLFNAVSVEGTEHPPQIWVKFFEHIAEYERLYRALLGRRGSSWFVLKMRAFIMDLLNTYAQHPQWQASPDRPLYPTTDDFVPNLIATMMIESITWWLDHGRPYTPQEITTRCVLLASTIFKETSTWR